MKLGISRPDRLKHRLDSFCVWARTLLKGWRSSILRPAGWIGIFKLACFTFGTVTLAYCAWVVVEAAVTQARARGILSSLQRQQEANPSLRARVPLSPGAPVASLDSPRIGLSVMVLEGADIRTLRVGAGRLTGSGFPGSDGNVVIAGHRDTFFRPLRDVKVGDTFSLTTPEARYRYEVIWSRVVPPSETGVLQLTPEPSLTLVTCYPFSYIGPAPERLVIRARRTEIDSP